MEIRTQGVDVNAISMTDRLFISAIGNVIRRYQMDEIASHEQAKGPYTKSQRRALWTKSPAST